MFNGGPIQNADATALYAQSDTAVPSAPNLTLVEHFPFTQAPMTPGTTNPTVTRIQGITGRGVITFNTNYAAGFGLVTP